MNKIEFYDENKNKIYSSLTNLQSYLSELTNKYNSISVPYDFSFNLTSNVRSRLQTISNDLKFINDKFNYFCHETERIQADCVSIVSSIETNVLNNHNFIDSFYRSDINIDNKNIDSSVNVLIPNHTSISIDESLSSVNIDQSGAYINDNYLNSALTRNEINAAPDRRMTIESNISSIATDANKIKNAENKDIKFESEISSFNREEDISIKNSDVEFKNDSLGATLGLNDINSISLDNNSIETKFQNSSDVNASDLNNINISSDNITMDNILSDPSLNKNNEPKMDNSKINIDYF